MSTTKQVTKIVLKTFTVKSPIHGIERGEVIRAAHVNDRGFPAGEPSFRKPYLVAEACADTVEDIKRFLTGLARQGYRW